MRLASLVAEPGRPAFDRKSHDSSPQDLEAVARGGAQDAIPDARHSRALGVCAFHEGLDGLEALR